MKKKTDKQILFERMNKVAGMPLKEDYQTENFPPGAEYDPNAPWNESDEDEEINEPDPDEYRDDDVNENVYSNTNIFSGLSNTNEKN